MRDSLRDLHHSCAALGRRVDRFIGLSGWRIFGDVLTAAVGGCFQVQQSFDRGHPILVALNRWPFLAPAPAYYAVASLEAG